VYNSDALLSQLDDVILVTVFARTFLNALKSLGGKAAALIIFVDD